MYSCILCKQYQDNISSRFPGYSEAFASEYLENHDQIYINYCKITRLGEAEER